ncbi:MAG: ABC transporter ATP-binding protein [Thermodesulfobacteriota bacterium]
MAWLSIQDLESFYHRIQVIHGLQIEVERGDFVSVIGSNGAGKTTLLRTISRLVEGRGKILLEGEDLLTMGPREVICKGVIHCPEGRLLFPRMTVKQNLLMGAFLRQNKEEIKGDLERVFSYLPILEKRQRQLAGTLSGGEQQMLAIGRSIMGAPKLLTLDEPSFGLAPLVIGSIFQVLHSLNQHGVTLILVEQNARLALEHARFTFVLEEGHLIKQGLSCELLGDQSIRAAYLGMA